MGYLCAGDGSKRNSLLRSEQLYYEAEGRLQLSNLFVADLLKIRDFLTKHQLT